MNEYPLVKPLYEREGDSVPGPFYVVLGDCITCAGPVDTAPGNITWSLPCKECPNHCRVERQPETPEETERIIQAACNSCIEAIRYCGTDPRILNRFRELKMDFLCDAIPQIESAPKPTTSWWMKWTGKISRWLGKPL